ncbi:MAG: guanylate kinase [Desulfobacteraceae bacterium Eth-SRB1]|nr:MAG: guanylate kinase [Desulfobacteraceae bacterium Eth-SRB1]
MSNSNTANLYIVSAPSGAGKTTLCRAVLDRLKCITYSVSYTTRKPRKGEHNGVDYNFITTKDFKKGIETGRWAEWAEVYGNYYGTSAEFLDNCLSSGNDILLDIDVQGAMQIIERYLDSITVFILPPSLDVLRSRLESRGADSKQSIVKRLAAAEKEMEKKDLYQHVIVNDNLSDAVSELIKIIEKYR